MSLNISKQERSIWTSSSCFSERTNRLVNKCINELLNSGVPVNSKICYFTLINGIWHLNMSVKYLGYLDEKNGDEVFKKLIRSIESDVGRNIICIIFPNNVSNCPYKDITVITSEVLLNGFTDFVESNARVVAYNVNRVPYSLRNFTFSGGTEEQLKDMMLASGNAKTMANSLNRSGFCWENWVPVKDDYKSMKIKSTDSLGNVRYIEVIL